MSYPMDELNEILRKNTEWEARRERHRRTMFKINCLQLALVLLLIVIRVYRAIYH